MADEDIFSRQNDVIGQLVSFVSNFGKTPKDRFNIGYLESRSNGLQKLWSEFLTNHKIILLETSAEDRSQLAYFDEGHFDKYEALYYDTVGKIAQKIIDIKPPIQNPSNPTGSSGSSSTLLSPIPNTSASTSFAAPNAPIFSTSAPVNNFGFNASHVQIPRLNVPIFDGSYDDWPSFRDLFTAAVHSNQTLQPVHKLQYLKSLLKGSAESLLKYLPTTSANYAIAWRKLEDRFNNRRALISNTLGKLFSQIPADETASSIRNLLDTSNECIDALGTQGIATDTWDPILIHIITQRIPTTTLNLWEQSIPRNHLPTIPELFSFLDDRFRTLEFVPAHPESPSQNIHPRKQKQQSFHTTSLCRVCSAPQHPLRSCPKFIAMQPSHRFSYVTKAKLCKNCFAYSHPTASCKSSGTCNTCGEKHHTMLHLGNQNESSNVPAPQAQLTPARPAATPSVPVVPPTSTQASSYISRPNFSVSEDSLLATALVSVKAFDGRSHTFRALLDNCSQENFVSKRLLTFIGTKPKPTTLVIGGIGQSQAPKPLGKIHFTFGSLQDASFSMTIEATVLPAVTHPLPTKSVIVDQQFIADLNLADPSYGTPGNIDILLSSNVFAALTIPCVRKDSTTATIAVQTKLGWVLYGEAIANSTQHQRACFHTTTSNHISEALQDFWRIEEVAMASSLTPDDSKCEDIFATTHTRNSDGRYCVQLPFKQFPPVIGTSRDRAVSRFLQVERKLIGNPQLHNDYKTCINEYLELGHMHPVSTTEQNHRKILPNGDYTYASYYLPHHAVIKMDSTTTKLRVVFDASCKSSNGTSLNETLFIGPTLQDTLFNLLLRWRTHKIVIKADIAKMYRQILVSDQHQQYQRIVWRNSPTDPLQDFALRTVTFGTAAAPYLAIKTIQQLANDESSKSPIGAESIKLDFYVDDLLSGADSIEAAIEKRNQVTSILKSGGFDIRKWSSNHEQVTNQLEDAAREICSAKDASLKALGILWCPRQDVLSIKVSLRDDNAVLSKRSLLSEISTLFDPLGWIAPSIIKMKIVLQKLWLAGLTWDEPLPDPIRDEWFEFKRQLPSIETIRINRWINTLSHTPFEIHGFCDASEKAYAAAIYVRTQIGPDTWSMHLIAAKTRVAPVKQVSLPRLELCGSVLLSKLLNSIKSTLNISSMFAWTDSEIVLAWLQGHPSRWTTFVANRVSTIHDCLDASAWHHISSKDNPADCASRGISPQQLLEHPLWWHGPSWLAKPESCWLRKQKKSIPNIQLEQKRVQTFISVPINDSINKILFNCGTLGKAVRVVAYILRWKTKKFKSPTILPSELSCATLQIIRYIQNSNFPEEYNQLLNDQLLATSSKLLSLNPFMDNDKIIRVGGRLKNADIPFSCKHPIIIPRKSRFTELLVAHAHSTTLHGGLALMLCHLRSHYWIIDAKNTIRCHIHKCNKCFRYSTKPLSQLMGELPKPRVNISSPFSHTGIDYAGPISILQRRRPGRPQLSKGYICLFVCLSTKAIHLELVGDMSAATFIAALDRFTSRRGIPSDIYSDNGTYFACAGNDLDADLLNARKSNPQEAAKTTAHQSIQWHFIPPAAPHFGGLWEAGVKSTKYHLRRVVGNGTCTYEELLTILCQIEACLNSRPLCPISSDINDFEILTPGHFLIGRPILTRPQPSSLETPTNRLSYWRRIYQTTERFWKQWQSDYLSRMQQRPKWTLKAENVEVGELVLLKEENLPPSQWKLVRIIEVHKGSDNIVRVVTIKTPTTILKRPIVKICKLPSQ